MVVGIKQLDANELRLPRHGDGLQVKKVGMAATSYGKVSSDGILDVSSDGSYGKRL